jgi:hypothetical protein
MLKHLKYIMVFQNCGIQIIPKMMILHTTWWFVSMLPAIMVLWQSGFDRIQPERCSGNLSSTHLLVSWEQVPWLVHNPCSTIEYSISPYFTINHCSGRVRAGLGQSRNYPALFRGDIIWYNHPECAHVFHGRNSKLILFPGTVGMSSYTPS